jgi:hypothetical protein
MSWYYLVKKGEHYVIATHSNVEEFEEYGFHKVFGFSGQRYHVEFYTIKALWHDEVLHKKRKDARLWRIAMDMETPFAEKYATHKERLKRQAEERKKKRIFPEVGMQISRKQVDWLACPKCHRIYNNSSDEYKVEQDRKVYAIELACYMGRRCEEDNKRFQLVRLRTSGKNPNSETIYTVRFAEYHMIWPK